MDLAVLDTTTSDLPEWAGGAVRLQGGACLFAYEKFTVPGTVNNGQPGVYVREATGPYGPFGGEVLLNDPINHGGYDPTWFKTPDGQIWAAWSGDRAFWVAKRNGANDYGDPIRVWTAGPDEGMSEPHAFYIDRRTFVAYDFRTDLSKPWDVRVRTVGQDLVLGPERTIAAGAIAGGNQGDQRRITVVGDGAGDLIAAWNGLPNIDGERSIVISKSDDGDAWDEPRTIATFPGHDLVNPTGVRIGPTDVRLYYAQDRARYPFGYVRSADHGATWTHFDVVDYPPRIGTTHVYVFRADKDLVAFVHADRSTKLGTFKLETIN